MHHGDTQNTHKQKLVRLAYCMITLIPLLSSLLTFIALCFSLFHLPRAFSCLPNFPSLSPAFLSIAFLCSSATLSLDPHGPLADVSSLHTAAAHPFPVPRRSLPAAAAAAEVVVAAVVAGSTRFPLLVVSALCLHTADTADAALLLLLLLPLPLQLLQPRRPDKHEGEEEGLQDRWDSQKDGQGEESGREGREGREAC